MTVPTASLMLRVMVPEVVDVAGWITTLPEDAQV
jgi:hypothetical protein